MSVTPQSAQRTVIASAVQALGPELYDASGAEQFGMAVAEFRTILISVAEKYLPTDADSAEAHDMLRSLRVADLALARACARGHERAWEQFMARFREKLYDSARAIAGDDSRGRELADSLYADLYGLNERQGERTSKLTSYHGRGSLDGWLRTVLAQEFINRYRTQKRRVSLDEKEEEGPEFAAPTKDEIVTVDPRLNASVDEALGSLPSEERVILAAYYLDGRRLAEIGRMLGFHEATASRKLERITKNLRKAIREGLVKRGMSRRQADEALEADVRDLNVSVRENLAQDSKGPPFHKQRTSG